MNYRNGTTGTREQAAEPPVCLRSRSLILYVLACCAFSLCFSIQLVAQNSQKDAPETQDFQRYAFLFQTAFLCTWPESTFEFTDDRFVVGILGRESNPKLLDKLNSRLDKVGGRPLVIERYASVQKIPNCQILYITSTVSQEAQRQAIQQLQGKPVLVIGETRDFTRQGGCIGLTVQGDVLEREFNTGVIRRQNVIVDLRLQKGGRFVETQPVNPSAKNSLVVQSRKQTTAEAPGGARGRQQDVRSNSAQK